MNPDRRKQARRRWSLRNRLLLLAAAATVAAWFAGGVAVYLVAAMENTAMDDEQMADIGRVILQFSDHEIDEIRAEGRRNVHVETAVTLGTRYVYQVFSAHGEALLLSFNAPEAPMAPLDQADYVTREVGGAPMRTRAIWNDDRTKVLLVAEPMSARSSFSGSLGSYLLAAAALSLPLVLLLNWRLFNRSTGSLDEASSQLVDRSPHDLRPIAVDSPPSELEPLLRSMNDLFQRFEAALANEHRLTSAAAHELRTPLAAVKVQAQVAARARSPEEARRALDNLTLCIDRASRMVDQLLTLTRLDSLAVAAETFAPLRLDHVAAQVIDDLAWMIQGKRLHLTTMLRPAAVAGVQFGVAVMLRNLIDNAARYTPAGGQLRVTTGTDDGRACAIIEDSGPGIPPAERVRVYERFYRLPSNDDVDGCGIGLSIVRTVATLHGIDVSLGESELGGLRATVRFSSIMVSAARTAEVGRIPISDRTQLRTP